MAAFTVFLFVGLLLGLAWGKWNTSYGIIVLVTTICLELLLYPIGKRFSSFFHGAVGEFKASILLGVLGRDFKVFNNLVLSDRGDVDAVVVGPSGVWAIEVKHYDGKIRLDGDQLVRNGKTFRRDFLKQAFAEAAVTRECLESKGIHVPVTPVLLFTGSFVDVKFGLKPIKGVYVIGSSWVKTLLKKTSEAPVLSKEQIAEIAVLLEPLSA